MSFLEDESSDGGAGARTQLESYVFSCELSSEVPFYTFQGDEEEDLEHFLELRTICLGEGAKEENNVVEVTAMNHQGKKISVPVANLHISCLPMMIQNAAARLVFNQPKRAHVTPLLIELHWLPVDARIKFKTLTIAYKVMSEQAPSYLHSLLKAYAISRPLRSSSERRLALPNIHTKQSRLFSYRVPQWWNKLPSTTRSGESLTIFKRLLKTELFKEHLHES